MKNDTMSLKAKINNYAKACSIRPQAVLQTLMFERFLERLSRAPYRDHFVIKGGALISVILGVALRTTMDLDATLMSYPLTEESVLRAIQEICEMPLEDEVSFSDFAASPIRRNDPNGGLRIRFNAHFKSMVTPLSMDVSLGDEITPAPILHEWHGLLDEKVNIALLCYNVETILAEKVEAILSLGEFTTRPRDFYAVHALVNKGAYKQDLFNQALTSTATHRGTLERIKEYTSTLERIAQSADIRARWNSYAREYPYAREISLESTLEAVRGLMAGWTP